MFKETIYIERFISKAIPGVTFKQSGDFITAILCLHLQLKEYDQDPQAGTELPYGSGFAPVTKELANRLQKYNITCDNCGWEWKIEDGGKRFNISATYFSVDMIILQDLNQMILLG